MARSGVVTEGKSWSKVALAVLYIFYALMTNFTVVARVQGENHPASHALKEIKKLQLPEFDVNNDVATATGSHAYWKHGEGVSSVNTISNERSKNSASMGHQIDARVNALTFISATRSLQPESEDTDQETDDEDIAGLRLASEQPFHGIRAKISVCTPKLETSSQSSSSFIKAYSGTTEISAGWEVYPGRHQDSETHLFVFTRNATKSCYEEENQCCFRFKNSWNNVAPVQGTVQFALEWGEEEWSLKINGVVIGGWREECIRGLETGAPTLLWGSSVSSGAQMGTGFRPTTSSSNEDSAFFSNLEYMEFSAKEYRSPDGRGSHSPKRLLLNEKCYNAIGRPPSSQYPERGYVMYYGGPMNSKSGCGSCRVR